MIEHEVVIAGAGPTGLMLAGELALAGINAVIIERRPTQDFAGTRAGGLHSRTIEVLDQRGIADRFLEAGQIAQVAAFAGIRLNISDFPTRHPYGLGLRQKHIERLLLQWTEELSVPIWRGVEVNGFSQNHAWIDVALSDGRSLRAKYLVGCDGGRSHVRKSAGIPFPGWPPTVSSIIAEVEMTHVPEFGVRQDAIGTHSFGRTEYEIRNGTVIYADSGPVIVMVTEEQVRTGEPTLSELRDALVKVYGTDFGAHDPKWLSRFTDSSRQAAAYRQGRVLLAGDAAHVHAPDGGQGLNIGVQDAVNLGWKLARVIKGQSSDELLNTYHDERHPIAARVLQLTMAAVALRRRPDERTLALRESISELLSMEEPRKRYAGMMSGLDIHYGSGDGHPLLGRRAPDLELLIEGRSHRLFSLLHAAQPVLLNFDPRNTSHFHRWAGRVRLIDATFTGPWELPVIGTVAAPEAVLIRPDGYVAWVGDSTRSSPAEARSIWFGS